MNEKTPEQKAAERERRSKMLDLAFEGIRARILDADDYTVNAEVGIDEEIVETNGEAWIASKPNGSATFVFEIGGGAKSNYLGLEERLAWLEAREKKIQDAEKKESAALCWFYCHCGATRNAPENHCGEPMTEAAR